MGSRVKRWSVVPKLPMSDVPGAHPRAWGSRLRCCADMLIGRTVDKRRQRETASVVSLLCRYRRGVVNSRGAATNHTPTRCNKKHTVQLALPPTMSGTWLQEGYYGSGLSISPGLSGKETDDELISFAKRQPAIATARKLCKHSWVVITAIFRSQPHSILAPRVHEPLDPACWLAFVDAPSKHDTPGWSQVPLVLFDEWEPNANLAKTMPPLLFEYSSVFYLDFSLTRARCFAFPHLVRAKELASAPIGGHAAVAPPPSLSSSPSPLPLHLFASAIRVGAGAAVCPFNST